MAELWDELQQAQQPVAAPDMWSGRASYARQTPEMWEALMQAAPQQSPSLWPQPVQMQPDEPPNLYDVNERAAQRIRQSVRPEGGRQEQPGQIVGPPVHLLGHTLEHINDLGRKFVDAAQQRSDEMTGQPTVLSSDVDPTRSAIAAELPLIANLWGVGAASIPKGAVGALGGKLAKTADLAALARAEAMTAKGVPAEQIWKDTGWFTGADNKWRFEIPDAASKWSADPKLNSMVAGDKPTPINQTFSHPELYEAYPQLRDADLNMMGRPTGYKGMYQAGSEGSPATITLAPGSPASMRSTALHELQHGVQDIEGFARGGNTIGLRPGTPAWDIYQERLTAMKTPLDKDTYSKVAGFGPEGATDKEYKEYLKIIKKPSPDAVRMAQEYGVENAYRRQAGEVEARNVQTRADYTPEQLRNQFPPASEDVLRENQFVNLKGDGPLFSKPRDPSLWHPIGAHKLTKPVSEMERHLLDPNPQPPTLQKPIPAEQLLDSVLLPIYGDRSARGGFVNKTGEYTLPHPVERQGGFQYMADAPEGQVWAADQGAAKTLADRIKRAHEQSGGRPVQLVSTLMGPHALDSSHHISDALAQIVKQAPVAKKDLRLFDELMKAPFGKGKKPEYNALPDWPGVNSLNLMEYLREAGGKTREKFAKLMDRKSMLNQGFPDIAELRHSFTDPRLLDAPSNSAGFAIAEANPKGLLAPSGHHTYNTGILGNYTGSTAAVPHDVMFSKLAAAYKAASPQTRFDYMAVRGAEPLYQIADKPWLENWKRYWEKGTQR